MAKSKKPKKLINSDKIVSKKSSLKSETKKINPFEVHVNKEKFDIIGRKHNHDHGMPGVSRGKAIKKRIETLGKEFKNLHKTNKFEDYRFSRNEQPDDELVANAKFVANHMSEFRSKRKQDLYNLNDDEVLTHKGQTLEEIERFDDAGEGSDESEDEALNARFTEAAHFGGENSNEFDRKSAIDQMIVESKRKKMEASKEKEEVYQLTNQLDENYRNLIPLLGKFSKKTNIKPGNDDYDRVMREMIFEPRGEVTDKLVSQEEIVKKEKERLENLENERLARMRGEDPEHPQNIKPTHKSADALDDGYFVGGSDNENNEDNKILAYDINEEVNNEDLDEDLDNENLSVDENDVPMGNSATKSSDGDEEEEEEEESSEDDEAESNFSDLKMSDSESEEEVPDISKKNKSLNRKQNESLNRKQNDIKAKTSVTIKELPFTFSMPVNYEELEELLQNQEPQCQKVIVERILKCNHPKLDGSNRMKIPGFLRNLLDFVGKQFAGDNIKTAFKILDMQMTNIYDITLLVPDKNSQIFIDILHEKYTEYKKNSKQFPPLDVTILFKIISNLFSTSDFRHPVVTIAYIFISHILSTAKVKSRKDCAQGLFTCTTLLEYTTQSKRFLPACFNYLLGIIHLSVPKRPIEIIKIVPPFSSTGPLCSMLALEKLDYSEENLLNSMDFVEYNIDEDFKVRALNTTIKLVNEFFAIIEGNIGSSYLAEPFINLLEKIPLAKYPKFVEKNTELLLQTLKKQTEKPLKKIMAVPRKPKALRLMEPRIETVYDDKRRPKLSKEKEMRKILEHKVKRETKGALREIRRDNEFLHKLKIKKQLESDVERKEKVKRIYTEASIQQGELNELARSKKKGKF